MENGQPANAHVDIKAEWVSPKLIVLGGSSDVAGGSGGATDSVGESFSSTPLS